MLNNVLRSSILDEFSSEEAEHWFGIKEKAVSHHIDTLYYGIFINHDGVSIKDDSAHSHIVLEGISDLLFDIDRALCKVVESPGAQVDFYGLTVCRKGAQISGGLYGYHLSDGDGTESNFDVFISSYLPNEDTPRIHVQLRTRSLILDGLYGSIERSFEKVQEILRSYNLSVSHVLENRIDYAFHTNAIQRPGVVFGDRSLSKHLDTTFREFGKHAWITGKAYNFFDLDYFCLGSRRANNVFFRAYEKTKEVVQKNYKAFFFKMWHDRGLISNYDLYVYERAYVLNSFKTGCLVGRVEWYLEHGKNEDLKIELRQLLETCNIKSDNNPEIERKIDGVLPPTTVIINVEFETKRKYYAALKCFFDSRYYTSVFYKEPKYSALQRLHKILSYRREIIDDLTTKKVCFVADRQSDELCDWWNRIKRVRIDDQCSHSSLELFRSYAQDVHGKLVARNFLNNVSSYAMFKHNSVDSASFGEDMWDVLTSLNDNDMVNMESAFDKFFKGLYVDGYMDIRNKRSRRLKSVISKKSREEQKKEIYSIERSLLSSDDLKDTITFHVKVHECKCTACGRELPGEDFVFEGPRYDENMKIIGRQGLCRDCAYQQKIEKRGFVI